MHPPEKQTIRTESLLPGHQDFLWEMLYLAIYLPPGHTPYPRAILEEPRIAAYAQDWGRAGDMGRVAREPGTDRPLGAAWLRLFPAQAPGYGFVAADTPELSMAVMPDCRGRGIGRQLLRELLQAAQSRYPAVSLSVVAENPALRLYQSFGFKTLCRDGDSVTMRKLFLPV